MIIPIVAARRLGAENKMTLTNLKSFISPARAKRHGEIEGNGGTPNEAVT